MVTIISSEDKKIRKLVDGLYFKTKQEAINYLETFKIKACDISNCSFITLEERVKYED